MSVFPAGPPAGPGSGLQKHREDCCPLRRPPLLGLGRHWRGVLLGLRRRRPAGPRGHRVRAPTLSPPSPCFPAAPTRGAGGRRGPGSPPGVASPPLRLALRPIRFSEQSPSLLQWDRPLPLSLVVLPRAGVGQGHPAGGVWVAEAQASWDCTAMALPRSSRRCQPGTGRSLDMRQEVCEASSLFGQGSRPRVNCLTLHGKGSLCGQRRGGRASDSSFSPQAPGGAQSDLRLLRQAGRQARGAHRLREHLQRGHHRRGGAVHLGPRQLRPPGPRWVRRARHAGREGPPGRDWPSRESCVFAGSSEDEAIPMLVAGLKGLKVIDVACGSGDAQTLAVTDNGAWSSRLVALRRERRRPRRKHDLGTLPVRAGLDSSCGETREITLPGQLCCAQLECKLDVLRPPPLQRERCPLWSGSGCCGLCNAPADPRLVLRRLCL